MGALPNKKRVSSHIQGPTLVEMFNLKSLVWEPHNFLEIKEQFNQQNKGQWRSMEARENWGRGLLGYVCIPWTIMTIETK